MKAKEYADMYIKAENKQDEAVKIVKMFLQEIIDLSKARNAKFDRALIPICKDLNQKWVKYAQLVNKHYPVTEPIKYSGFKGVIEKFNPELYQLWLSS
jgi:hypothetical protein